MDSEKTTNVMVSTVDDTLNEVDMFQYLQPFDQSVMMTVDDTFNEDDVFQYSQPLDPSAVMMPNFNDYTYDNLGKKPMDKGKGVCTMSVNDTFNEDDVFQYLQPLDPSAMMMANLSDHSYNNLDENAMDKGKGVSSMFWNKDAFEYFGSTYRIRAQEGKGRLLDVDIHRCLNIEVGQILTVRLAFEAVLPFLEHLGMSEAIAALDGSAPSSSLPALICNPSSLFRDVAVAAFKDIGGFEALKAICIGYNKSSTNTTRQGQTYEGVNVKIIDNNVEIEAGVGKRVKRPPKWTNSEEQEIEKIWNEANKEIANMNWKEVVLRMEKVEGNPRNENACRVKISKLGGGRVPWTEAEKEKLLEISQRNKFKWVHVLKEIKAVAGNSRSREVCKRMIQDLKKN